MKISDLGKSDFDHKMSHQPGFKEAVKLTMLDLGYNEPTHGECRALHGIINWTEFARRLNAGPKPVEAIKPGLYFESFDGRMILMEKVHSEMKGV
jgi:hypothetical protein